MHRRSFLICFYPVFICGVFSCLGCGRIPRHDQSNFCWSPPMTTASTIPSQLSYATPMPSARPGTPWILVIMTALVMGFLVADAYGLTAGFQADAEATVTVRIIGGLLAI